MERIYFWRANDSSSNHGKDNRITIDPASETLRAALETVVRDEMRGAQKSVADKIQANLTQTRKAYVKSLTSAVQGVETLIGDVKRSRSKADWPAKKARVIAWNEAMKEMKAQVHQIERQVDPIKGFERKVIAEG